ncbi:MAG: LPP20 family lipoprotein [Acidaminococcaceae bacterium]|nr:LPP20 family lipoprotein [Acidaminococcaceae bacterium]
MSIHINKTLSITLALTAAVTFTGFTSTPVFAEPATTNVSVNVELQQKSGIHWDKGAESDVTAMGIGLPPDNAGARGNVLARRAAVVDAQRNLAEIINGVQIDSETILENLSVSSDLVRSKVSGLIQGARIIDEGLNPDGSYFVVMRVPMYGTQSSIASAVLPELRDNVAPEPLPKVNVKESALSKKEVKALQGAGYTGIVIDADNMGLEPTFSPVIYDVNGRVVYGIKNLDYDYAISRGMVAYANTVESAMQGERAGNNPLVIKAANVRGGRNSVNNVNVVVSVEDGDRILLACEKSNILQHAAVVFVR